ncbi:unnamed protein product, partial [Scytosiphon promiscuus]
KSSLKGSEDRAGARLSNVRRPNRGDEHDDSGDRGIAVVGEKATASTRGEPAASQKPARTEVQYPEKESPREAVQEQKRSGFAELVQAEIQRTSGVQKLEHLKERTAHALQEVSIIRAKLERAEAAVIGSKKKRDVDVAERETQLRRCEEEIRRLSAEGEFYRVQLRKSVEDGTRLGDELKRTQESLLFLSAWDEEKIELEAEVASLNAQLSSATEDGNKRLERAHHEFNIISATSGQKARLRLARQGLGKHERDTEKIRLDLERGLSEEFKTLRRENEVLRRERTHKDSEINRIMKNAAQIESDQRAARAELDDERRMHHATIRRKKQAEAAITELQAQLSMALSAASGKPCAPSSIILSPSRPKMQWNSPRAPAPVRGKMMIRGEEGDNGYREAFPENGRRNVSRVSMLLVSAGTGRKRAEEGGGGDCRGGTHAAQIAAGAAVVVASPVQGRAMVAGAPPPVGRREHDLPPKSDGDSMHSLNIYREGVGGQEGGHTSTRKSDCPAYGGGRREGEEDGDAEDIPELLPCGSSSEITSGDVWGMLDSYVHRRSEVARANRHLSVIEAMRKHLEKTNERGANAAGSNRISATAKNAGKTGRKRTRVVAEGCEGTKGGESVWKISRPGESFTKMQTWVGGPPLGFRPAHKKTAVTKAAKPRVRYKPHPPPRCERDASVSSISQMTAVSSWRECGTDGQTVSSSGTSRTGERNPPNNPPPLVSQDDGGRDCGELRDHGSCDAGVDDCNSQRDRGGRVRRGGSLTSPSSNTEDGAGGDGGRPSAPGVLPSGGGKGADSTSLFAQQYRHQQGGGDENTSTIARSPSPTNGLAMKAVRRIQKAGGEPAAARLWGGGDTVDKRRDGGAPGLPRRRRSNQARKAAKATGFRFGRRTELATWIETNTNLVNVSPW